MVLSGEEKEEDGEDPAVGGTSVMWRGQSRAGHDALEERSFKVNILCLIINVPATDKT